MRLISFGTASITSVSRLKRVVSQPVPGPARRAAFPAKRGPCHPCNGVSAATLWRTLAARSGGLSPAENSSRRARAAFVVVDWGTSSFRGWLMSADGEALAESRGGEGMLHCTGCRSRRLRAGAARSPRQARRAEGSPCPDLRHGGRATGLGRSTLSQDTDAAGCPARGRHPDRRARRHPHPAGHRPGAARPARRHARGGNPATGRDRTRLHRSRLHSRHPQQMGQDRSWSPRRVLDLHDRRAVLGDRAAQHPRPRRRDGRSACGGQPALPRGPFRWRWRHPRP